MSRTRPVAASRYSLSEQVRNHVLNMISIGDLAPGDRIVEARIANELKVSSIPVADAPAATVLVSRSVAPIHNLAVLSLLPLANVRPSGEKASERTWSVWPVRVANSLPVFKSHSFTV